MPWSNLLRELDPFWAVVYELVRETVRGTDAGPELDHISVVVLVALMHITPARHLGIERDVDCIDDRADV